jgi:hypothetical protein
MSRRDDPGARRLALPSTAQLGRLARRLDNAMGEINPYLSALAIGLLVLNLTALLLLAPYLKLRGSAYFPMRPPACATTAENPIATINAIIRSGT